MQIPGSNYSVYTTSTRNVAFPSGGVAATKPDYAKLADYDSHDNVIFQNLLKNPTVQDNVVLNEDGTYSFIMGEDVLSEEEGAMRTLINEQNGNVFQPGAVASFSRTELAMFRQMTGYNLLQADGGSTVVDDFGRAPLPGDQKMVKAVWEMFDLAKGIQELEEPDGEINIDGLKAVGTMLQGRFGADTKLYQHLIDMLTEMEKAIDRTIENIDAL